MTKKTKTNSLAVVALAVVLLPMLACVGLGLFARSSDEIEIAFLRTGGTSTLINISFVSGLIGLLAALIALAKKGVSPSASAVGI